VGRACGGRALALEARTWWTATAEQEVLLSIGQRPSALNLVARSIATVSKTA
jgi:hypothetical protein